MVPSALADIAKSIYYRLYRLLLRVRFWFADRVAMRAAAIPVPPAVLRFRVSESLSAPEFLRVGEGCAIYVRRHIGQMGINLENAGRVLDFGCGCGRTVRWFLRADGNAEFHGVDVDKDAIAWCRQHLPRGHFQAVAPTPPLPYPAQYFDAIYCFSVFTHLNELMQDLWLAELARLLKSGGVLLLTVYGAKAAMQLDAEDQRILRDSGFVHRRSQKLKGMLPDWYQTSWHTEQYIVKRLSVAFEDVRYSVIPDGLQDIVVGRRREYKED